MSDWKHGVSLRWLDAEKEEFGYCKRYAKRILFIIEAFKTQETREMMRQSASAEKIKAEAQALFSALEAEASFFGRLNIIRDFELRFRKMGCKITTLIH